MKYGIRTITTREAFTPEWLDRLAKLGFTAIELSFNRQASCLDWLHHAMAQSIREVARQHGVTLTAHAPDEICLTNPDKVELHEHQEKLRTIIESGPEWGFDRLVIHTCGGRKAILGEELAQAAALADSFARLAPACERSGVRLLAESSCPGTFTGNFPRLLEIVYAAASPFIGVCIDVNHLNIQYDLPTYIRAAGKLTGEIHANDNHGVREQHLMPYDGTIDWQGVAKALAEAGFDGVFIMEPDHFNRDLFPDLITAAAATAKRLEAEMAEALKLARRL